MVGRSHSRLVDAARGFESDGQNEAIPFIADLTIPGDIEKLVHDLSQSVTDLDILVHCAAAHSRELCADGSVDSFRRIMESNVYGPYLLTQKLLPMLVRACGDVVFMNSSVVKSSGAGVGQYAASKHALRSLAESLRAEVNSAGVRVLSVYPGRTATPMQRVNVGQEGRKYEPEQLLQPDDIAEMVVTCLCLAPTAEVSDLYIRPRKKPDPS